MKIHEGYAVLAFDFEVNPAQSYCLFSMKEMLVDREMRMLEKASQSMPGVKESLTNEVTQNMLRQGMEGLMNVAGKVKPKVKLPEMDFYGAKFDAKDPMGMLGEVMKLANND